MRLPRPSPALVIASFALLLAAEGVSFAAVKAATAVNIADPTTPSRLAHVDANGALATSATVPGGVTVALPRLPFRVSSYAFADGGASYWQAPTNATLAITEIRFSDNANGPASVFLYQYGAASASDCAFAGGSRSLGYYFVPANDTVVETMQTPLVLKRLAGAPYYCLVAFASDPGNTGTGLDFTVGGYVPSGSFTPAEPAAAVPGQPPHR